jgi:hypothetical protein
MITAPPDELRRLFPARNPKDCAVDFAEFSWIYFIFNFHRRIGVEDIAEQVEHARVRKAIVVVAQRETKPTFHPLDTDDNFHVNEIVRRAEAAA